MATTAHGQVYGYDRAMPLPTRDLYDTETMNMALAHAQMAAKIRARRKAEWKQYSELAYDAYDHEEWNDVIRFVNAALDTGFYNSDVYYMRGYALEMLGRLKEAKKDYKKAKEYGNTMAPEALKALKEKMKK